MTRGRDKPAKRRSLLRFVLCSLPQRIERTECTFLFCYVCGLVSAKLVNALSYIMYHVLFQSMTPSKRAMGRQPTESPISGKKRKQLTMDDYVSVCFISSCRVIYVG